MAQYLWQRAYGAMGALLDAAWRPRLDGWYPSEVVVTVPCQECILLRQQSGQGPSKFVCPMDAVRLSSRLARRRVMHFAWCTAGHFVGVRVTLARVRWRADALFPKADERADGPGILNIIQLRVLWRRGADQSCVACYEVPIGTTVSVAAPPGDLGEALKIDVRWTSASVRCFRGLNWVRGIYHWLTVLLGVLAGIAVATGGAMIGIRSVIPAWEYFSTGPWRSAAAGAHASSSALTVRNPLEYLATAFVGFAIALAAAELALPLFATIADALNKWRINASGMAEQAGSEGESLQYTRALGTVLLGLLGVEAASRVIRPSHGEGDNPALALAFAAVGVAAGAILWIVSLCFLRNYEERTLARSAGAAEEAYPPGGNGSPAPPEGGQAAGQAQENEAVETDAPHVEQ